LLDNEVSAVKERVNGVKEIRNSAEEVQKEPDVPDTSFEPSPRFNRTSEVQTPHQPYTNHNQSFPNSSSSKLSHNTHYNTNQNHYYDTSLPSTSENYIPNARKNLKSEFGIETPLLIDEDDHKYRRRSPFESLSRWIKNSATVKSKRGRKRTALYVILGILAGLLLLMFIFGRGAGDEGFDPEGNPNVMIGGGPGIHAVHKEIEPNET